MKVVSLSLLAILLSIAAFAGQTFCDRVIDGDTFVTSDGAKIRIIGIDAPENHPNSTQHLESLLGSKALTLVYEGDRIDKYGRTLARILLPDSSDVSESMCRDGYALAYLKYPCSHSDSYLQAEISARKAGRGIWAGHFQSTVSSAQSKIEPKKSSESQSVTVYITRTGIKYHRAGCRYLSKSCIPIDIKEARQQYSPCSVCNPP